MMIRRVGLWMIAALILTVGAGRADGLRTERGKSLAGQAFLTPITPIGNGIQVINESSLVEGYPAIAYNSTSSEYLVVWYNDRPGNDDIRAQRLSKNGSLIGGPFYISAAGAGIDRRYPRVAYNIKSDQYLVVWEHQESSYGYSIHGRRVSGLGQILDSNDIVIRSAGANFYTPAKPVVAYAYTSNKYLVVWDETSHPLPISTDIVGQVVLGTGALVGNLLTIAQDPGGYYRTNPDLAYNIGRNEYLVAWEQLDQDHHPVLTDIYARRVTGEGVLLTPASTPIAYYTVSSSAPSVAALPTQPDGQYLVVWELHYSQDDWDISGMPVSSDGTPQTAFGIVATSADETLPSVTGSAVRGQYLVTWKQVSNPSFLFSNIAGRLVTPSGSVAGGLINLSGLVADHPSVATGGTGDFLTVYDDIPLTSDSGIYGQLAGNRNFMPHVWK